MHPQSPCFSVDDYFTDPQSGVYRFRFDENHLAYKACEENTERAMLASAPRILVHNTFTLEWEMEPYIKMAARHGYTLFVCTVEKYHSSGNIHDIPQEAIQKMAAKYKVKLL